MSSSSLPELEDDEDELEDELEDALLLEALEEALEEAFSLAALRHDAHFEELLSHWQQSLLEGVSLTSEEEGSTSSSIRSSFRR